jgi:hypothetical protein
VYAKQVPPYVQPFCTSKRTLGQCPNAYKVQDIFVGQSLICWCDTKGVQQIQATKKLEESKKLQADNIANNIEQQQSDDVASQDTLLALVVYPFQVFIDSRYGKFQQVFSV